MSRRSGETQARHGLIEQGELKKMKRAILLCVLAFGVSFSNRSFADLLVNFDTGANWTAGTGSLTSYFSDHVYQDSGLIFTGGPALRQTTALQDSVAGAFGTYAWRIVDNLTPSWTATYSTLQSGNEIVSGFSFDVRRWDFSPSANRLVEYSLNGGSTYTSVLTISNAFLGNTSNWKSVGATFAPTAVTAGSFIVRVSGSGASERIMIDNFALTAIPEPSAYLFGALATMLAGGATFGRRMFARG
jgi:hypothetical protein